MNAEHPIFSPLGPWFELPPIHEFFEDFSRAFLIGDRGMLCHGTYRCGKTTVARRLVTRFDSTKTAVPFLTCAAGTVGAAQRFAALARGLRLSRTGQEPPFGVGSESDALVKRVHLDASVFGTNRVLFIIDEAHKLTLDHFNGLKSICERLLNDGLNPFVLLFAEPEIADLEKALIAAGNQGSLVDRFFLHKHVLRGLKLDELRLLLEEYDKQRWPVEGGPTYTEHFLPELWAQGWRLAKQSSAFEAAFKELAIPLRLHLSEVPIKYLTSAVKGFLIDAPACLQRKESLNNLIEDCVYRSGFVESLKVRQAMADADERVSARRRRGLRKSLQ